MKKYIFSLVSAVFMLFVVTASADAATYYVAKTGSNSNPCTQASPCLTIAQGLTKLAAGDTLIIRAGTYDENNLSSTGGTSETNRVTIKANSGETVIIMPSVWSGYAIYLTPSQSYITFEGLIIDGTNLHYGAWIEGLHIRFQNMEIRNVRGVTSGPQASGVGLAVYGNPAVDQYFELIDSSVHHTGATNTFCINSPDQLGCHGIYMQSNGNLVDRSSIYDNAGHGIQTYLSGGAPSNNILRNSRWYNNTWGPGIGVYSGTGNKVYNNQVYNNKRGIFTNGTSGIFLNNTLYANNDFGIDVAGSGNTFRNNIRPVAI